MCLFGASMKSRKNNGRASKPETALCKRCGASVGPLQLSWHRLSCISVQSNSNSTHSQIREPSPALLNKEEPVHLNISSVENGGGNIIVAARNGDGTGVQGSSPRRFTALQVEDLEGVGPSSALARLDDERESNARPCRVEVEEGGGLNPRPREMEAERGDYSVVLQNFRNPVSGKHVVSDCNRNELISCLRGAFQRRDFGVVVRTLRDLEERFRRIEEATGSELQARKRELEELRETEGRKLEKVQRKYEEALVREFQCQHQCEVLRERWEALLEVHKQTQEKLEDCERRCQALSRIEPAVKEKFEGLREICGEALEGEREGRKDTSELERKCKEEVASKEGLERVRVLGSNADVMAEARQAVGREPHDCRRSESVVEGDSNALGDRNMQRIEARKGKRIQLMECTPYTDACTPKPVRSGTELSDERGDRVRRVLFRSEREVPYGPCLNASANCCGFSSSTTDAKGSSSVPCTLDGRLSGCPDQLGKSRVGVGLGLQLPRASGLGSILVPGKTGGNLRGLSSCIPANISSHPGWETCKNGTPDNSLAKLIVPELVKGVEENAYITHIGEQMSYGLEVVRVEEDACTTCIGDELLENSTPMPNTNTGSRRYPLIDKHSGDHLAMNECSCPEPKTDVQRSEGSMKHVLIVISDSDSNDESGEVSLRKKRRISPFGMKMHSIQMSQCVEIETQSRTDLTGSKAVEADSDHSEERVIQRSAKSRRGCRIAVVSDSESNSSEAAFSCKRRKPKPSSLQTQTSRTNECIELEKHNLMNCIGACNLKESYHKTLKEDEVSNANCGPYECTRIDNNLGEEDLWANEEGECAPDVKFQRLRRVKEVNELNSPEQRNNHAFSVEEGECLPVIKFRRLRRVKEYDELHNSEQIKKVTCSIEEGEHVDILKFKNLQRVDGGNDLHTKELCKESKVNTVPEEQNISDPDVNVRQTNNITCVTQSRHYEASLDCRAPGVASNEESAGNIQFGEVLSGSINRFRHMCTTKNGKEDHIQTVFSNKTLDLSNCEKKTEGFRKGEEDIFIKECEDQEPHRFSKSPSIAKSNDKLKTINLLKESDGEDEADEVGSDSEGEDLGGFIVDDDDESETGTDAEGWNGSKGDISDTSDLEGGAQSLHSDTVSTSSSSDASLNQILRKLARRSGHMPRWQYEADMLAAFAKDPVLCMRAICALYRQQTNEEQSGKSSLCVNGRGFDRLHAFRGSLLAEFLTDGDPFGPVKKSIQELEKHDSKGVQFCRDLAFHHSKQLFEIYQKHEDQHFPYG